MLIWTTKGPKRAEKIASKEPSEEDFAETSTADDSAADGDKVVKADPNADVFLDRPAKPQKADAAEDGDWSSAETPRSKSTETTE